ncbi:MAG TPA: GNAT family N-acetyltransferase [Nocardioides sp.]|nr:GNAT family N-acetyltransferase [Nocardioides sp.]
MSRFSLTPRIAGREDAPVLAELWSDVLRRADRSEQVADLELIIKAAAASPEQRLVVVDYDGSLAGAVFLRITGLTPLNLESCVQAFHPRVFPQFRRHGVGRALMDAATTFAEEAGVLHIAAAVPQTSRESNRFMARLGFAPAAAYRVAATSMVRARISPDRSQSPAELGRSKVLAARRSLRRQRAVEQRPLGDQPPVAPEQ